MSQPDLPGPFLGRLKQLEEDLDKQEFYVLVWGSGESAKGDFEKRKKIRDDLAQCFGENNVFLSEDERFGPLVDKHGLAIAEAIQAEAIDAVVVLDTSIGPHSEILKYGDIIIGKAVVFVEHRYKKSESFANIAFDAVKVEGYTQEEYANCEKIRRVARNFISGLRFRNAYRNPLRESFGR